MRTELSISNLLSFRHLHYPAVGIASVTPLDVGGTTAILEQPNFLAFFVIGTLLFSIFSDGVSALFWDVFGGWLQAQLGIQSQTALRGYTLLVLMVVILGVIYGTNLSQWVRRLLVLFRVMDAVVPDQAKVAPLTTTCRGLVVVMSTKEDSPAEVAIRRHWNGGREPHLEHCWVICTEQSVEFAERMHQCLIKEGIGGEVNLRYGDYEVEDPTQPERKLKLTVANAQANDPNHILQLVEGIYAEAEALGLAESEMIVDFTGGTKPLGVGVFLACTRPERRLEYIAQGERAEILEVKVSYKLKPVK